jgi:hypothetical protein
MSRAADGFWRLRAARLALTLYPPAWRDRYGDEVLALLAGSGGGMRAAASLACHAVPAWICPPRHLHADRSARMRASLATVLLAWSILAALGLVFAQLTQLQGAVPPALTFAPPLTAVTLNFTPYAAVLTWSYRVFDAALIASALAIGAGGLPLWLVMLRRARRERRTRDLVCLLMPVIAPTAYLIAVVIAVSLIRAAQVCRAHDPLLGGGCQPSGVGPRWFLVFVLVGFAAAISAALGPARALRSMKPRGPAVRVASRAAAIGVGGMLVAATASGTAAISLYLFARSANSLRPYVILQSFKQYGNVVTLVVYLAVVLAAAAVATISAGRAARAALAGSL